MTGALCRVVLGVSPVAEGALRGRASPPSFFIRRNFYFLSRLEFLLKFYFRDAANCNNFGKNIPD